MKKLTLVVLSGLIAASNLYAYQVPKDFLKKWAISKTEKTPDGSLKKFQRFTNIGGEKGVTCR